MVYKKIGVMIVLCCGLISVAEGRSGPLKPIFTFDTSAQNVEYDSDNKSYKIYYESYEGERKFWVLEPANKVEVYIDAKVEFSPVTEAYIYSYEVTSTENSLQSVWTFSVKYEDFEDAIVNVSSPEGWFAGAFSYIPILDWGGDPYYDKVIKPGEKQGGFSFQSQGLPGIVKCYAEGYTELFVFSNFESECAEAAGPPLPDPIENCVRGNTVGPIVPPEVFEPLSFLDNLISLKEQAYSLGWINNKGILNSLNQKLEAVRKNIQKGKIKTAKNILGAFINEVEAQKEKHLSSEAYALLKFNAQYLKENL
ncbi:MAG: hypothetical protein AB1797_10090 [bacterium]